MNELENPLFSCFIYTRLSCAYLLLLFSRWAAVTACMLIQVLASIDHGTAVRLEIGTNKIFALLYAVVLKEFPFQSFYEILLERVHNLLYILIYFNFRNRTSWFHTHHVSVFLHRFIIMFVSLLLAVIFCELLLESGAGAVYCGLKRIQQMISRAVYACYIVIIPEAGGMATGHIATVIELIWIWGNCSWLYIMNGDTSVLYVTLASK